MLLKLILIKRFEQAAKIIFFSVGACVPLRPPAHYGDPALCESSGPLEIPELVPVR